MNAYLFSADATATKTEKKPTNEIVGVFSQPVTWEMCLDMIVRAETPEQGESRFREWLAAPKEETSITEVRKVTAAQFVDQLLTESGSAPLDWPAVSEKAVTLSEGLPADDFEQGYWVDVNTVFNQGALPGTMEELKASLPADIAEGLNWAGNRTFLFIIGVLRPRAAQPVDEETVPFYDDGKEEGRENEEGDVPEAIDRECAAMVQARNSVVAAWLWKRFSAALPVAEKEIQIVPWCGCLEDGQ